MSSLDESILKKMDNGEIILHTHKLNALSNTIDKIVGTFEQIGNSIEELRILKGSYLTILDKLEEQYKPKYEFYTEEKKQKLVQEAFAHTKQRLVEDYLKTEAKYNENLRIYNCIDYSYYEDTLNDIIEEIL